MANIKIIHIISSFRRGGRERQLATILNHTDQIKYPSKVIYFKNSTLNYFDEYKLKDKAILIASGSFGSRLLELHRLLKKEKPDVVYTWGNLESVFLLLLNPFHPYIFINGSIRHGIRSHKFSHYFRTIILKLSKIVVANSKSGLKANHLRRGHVLYNGVEEKFIGMLSIKEKKSIRQALLNIDHNYTLLISVANLVPYKDYFSVISVLKKIKDKGYKFYYLIFGEGPLRTQIEEKIIEYGLTYHIKMFGNVPNMQYYFQLADIFIHSSKGEGCSNAILEAMAAGLPIIASNTGGTCEIVTNKNGFLFEYKNSKELFDKLKYCLDNLRLCRQMGIASIKIIKESFSAATMIENYYKIINISAGDE